MRCAVCNAHFTESCNYIIHSLQAQVKHLTNELEMRPKFACRACGDSYEEGWKEPCGGAVHHIWVPVK